MKKLWAMGLILLSFSAQAQMTDTLGALTLQGVLTQGSTQGVKQMQNALENTQFQQKLSALIAEVQMTFAGDYTLINKELLAFDGFNGISWDAAGVSSNEFYIELKGLNGAQCFICQSNQWKTSGLEINGNTSCQATDNNVKMYFRD